MTKEKENTPIYIYSKVIEGEEKREKKKWERKKRGE